MQASAQRYTGVNIAGGEFGNSRTGIYNKSYIYPNASDFANARANGMTVARVPIKWERIQHSLRAPLDTVEMARLDATVAAATAAGVSVILDLHNYGLYDSALVGSAAVPDAAFADLWRRLGEHYRGQHVIFGLMNEPHGLPAAQWRKSAEAALHGVREAGARNLVLVPGVRWTGAHSWMKPAGDSNAEALATLSDTAQAVAIEMHQYLDADSSGTHTSCVSADIGSQRLAAATDWLRSTKHVGFLGEFAGSTDPVCLAAMDKMLAFMKANSDVWIGWTYWAAGRWWGNYPFSIQPNADGAAKPQLGVLRKYVKGPHS